MPQDTSQAGHQFHYDEKWDDMLVECIRLELNIQLSTKYRRKAFSNPPLIKLKIVKNAEEIPNLETF